MNDPVTHPAHFMDFVEIAKRHQKEALEGKSCYDWRAEGRFRYTDCTTTCINNLAGIGMGFDALCNATGYPEFAHLLQESISDGLGKEDGLKWHIQFFEKAKGVDDWFFIAAQTMIAAWKIVEPELIDGYSDHQIRIYEEILQKRDCGNLASQIESNLDFFAYNYEASAEEWGRIRDAFLSIDTALPQSTNK